MHIIDFLSGHQNNEMRTKGKKAFSTHVTETTRYMYKGKWLSAPMSALTKITLIQIIDLFLGGSKRTSSWPAYEVLKQVKLN